MNIAIAVVTCCRPAGLARLLDAIAALHVPAGVSPAGPAAIEVVIVDNDRGGSAVPACDAARRTFPWPLRSSVEPRQGIPFARNAAVRVALANGADAIAFIDDDEVPEPAWLATLVAVQRRCAADVVFGPVLRRFESAVPAWVERGQFFARPRHETGAHVVAAGAGNVLVRARVFREMDRLFDERIGLASGEDHEFFTRVSRAGYTAVWADEAIVHELMPGDRATAAWLLRRAYSHGNTTWFLEREPESAPVRGAGIAVALAGLAKGLVMSGGATLVGRHAVVRRLQSVSYHLGALAAAAGWRYQEYGIAADARPAPDAEARSPRLDRRSELQKPHTSV